MSLDIILNDTIALIRLIFFFYHVLPPHLILTTPTSAFAHLLTEFLIAIQQIILRFLRFVLSHLIGRDSLFFRACLSAALLFIFVKGWINCMIKLSTVLIGVISILLH